MEDSVKDLRKKLDEFEEADEVLEYIDDIEDMLENDMYDKDKIIEIETQYSIESKFLLGFENPEKIGFKNNYDDSDKQVLLNLKDRLYFIAVLKVLEEEEKEIPKNLLKLSYSELLSLIDF